MPFCQCNAAPGTEIIFMGAATTHLTVARGLPHSCIWLLAAGTSAQSGSQSGSCLCSAAVAVALSRSGCVVLGSLLWKPERGAKSKWQAAGSKRAHIAHPADSPAGPPPSFALLAPTLSRHRKPDRHAKSPTASPPKQPNQPNIQTIQTAPSAARSALNPQPLTLNPQRTLQPAEVTLEI
ncbi:hypothetical protein N431DRAFT_457314 [Stipitochalara longipes BDJ]|nr:hypothetical protein N431DRAFT_457314 [Stipitochalara longipes BDJ]